MVIISASPQFSDAIRFIDHFNALLPVPWLTSEAILPMNAKHAPRRPQPKLFYHLELVMRSGFFGRWLVCVEQCLEY